MEEAKQSIKEKVRNGINAFLGYNQLDFFPLWKTIYKYNLKKFKSDLHSSLNISLFSFPQALAYALIGGLPIYFGVFGLIVACIATTIFSKSPYIILGPSNATSVILLSSFASLGLTNEDRLIFLPLLLILVGLILIIGSYFRIANLCQYISRSVITGYITAAAALIVGNQLKNILGIELNAEATTFLSEVRLTLLNIKDTQIHSVLLSGFTVAVFVALEKYLGKLPNVAITLAITSVTTYLLSLYGYNFDTLNGIDISEWQLTAPVIDLHSLNIVIGAAPAIALLCLLESSTIGKSLAARSGQHLDANQEMLSLGIANFSCGLFSGMPASGSLTRSTLSWKSGSKTPLVGIFTAGICAFFAFAIGSFASYIPKASLAVVVISIALALVNKHSIHIVLHATRGDAAVFITTLACGLLLPLDTAVYFGVALSILIFLRKASAPAMVEYSFNNDGLLTELQKDQKRPDPEISIVHVEGNLFFGAAELFRDQMRRVCEDQNLKVVILKIRNAYHIDATSVMALEELIKHMQDQSRTLLISEARRDIIRIFKKSELYPIIGEDNIFKDNPQNPTLSTANALRRAQDIIGGKKARVSIYFDPSKKPNLDTPQSK